MRRWAVLAILTYCKYVPVAVLRPPSLKTARYALERGVYTNGTALVFGFAFFCMTCGREVGMQWPQSPCNRSG